MAANTPANPPTFGAAGQPTLQQLVDYFVEATYEPAKLERLQNALGNGLGRGFVAAEGAAVSSIEGAVEKFVVPVIHVILKALLDAIKVAEPAFDEIGKVAVDAVLGERPRRGYVPDDVGARLLAKLAPANSTLGPSIEGAQRYLTLITHMHIEAWVLGFVTELVAESADMIRGAGGTIHSVAELREIITQVMGGGRITRRVLAPFIDSAIVTPARWHTNKLYHPELLSPAAAVAAWRRGDFTDTERDEEIDRQGLDQRRAAALINASKERLNESDVEFFLQSGTWSETVARAHYTSRGMDDETATLHLLAIQGRRIQALDAQLETLAVAGYADRVLTDLEFDNLTAHQFRTLDERRHLRSVAELKRQLNSRRISSTQLRGMVKDGVATVADYRRALEREGYPFDDVTFFELQLRVELQQQRDVDKARAEMKADHDRAKLDAAAAKVARDAALADRQTRAAFPALGEYRRAYVHGLIQRDLYVAALGREHITEELDVVLADADADRDAYLAAEAKRAAAAAGVKDSTLSIATLEQAVLADVLTLSEFDATLQKRGVPDDDRRVYVSLLGDKLQDRDDARAKRAAAAAKAQLGGVSLDAFAHAVRLGVRSRADYQVYLESIGTSDVAVALILDLLDAELAKDADTRAKRDALEAAAALKGISLAQRRRAYIAGIRPRTFYADALVAAGWPVDDQLAELDLADVEAAAAADARARRAAIGTAIGTPTVTLGQMERAFVLGLVTQGDLRDYLTAKGYAAADVDLVVQLAVANVPTVRAGQQLHQTVAAALTLKGISLDAMDRAVLRGIRTLGEYAAELGARGYAPDAIDLLTQLLAEKADADFDGLRKRIAAALAKAADAPTLDELIEAFNAGELEAPQLRDLLVSFAVDRDAALVFSRLLPTFGLDA